MVYVWDNQSVCVIIGITEIVRDKYALTMTQLLTMKHDETLLSIMHIPTKFTGRPQKQSSAEPTESVLYAERK